MQQVQTARAGEQVTRQEKPTGVLPLTFLAPGTYMTVCGVRGRDDTRRMLADMGFVEGAAVSVVSQSLGNVIVNVKGARVALDQKLAARVMVA